MSVTTEDDKIAYCSCMEQVKRRLRLVRSIAAGKMCTDDGSADAELACFQLRKALELIAFATLAANRDRYSQIRKDVEKEWSAKKILTKLKQMHPEFYPIPVKPTLLRPGHWHFEPVPEGFLTEEEFVFLYDQCSEVIHEWNPFRSAPRLVDFGRSVTDWAERIDCLLNFHYIQLVDQTDILLVQLVNSADGKASVLTAVEKAI